MGLSFDYDSLLLTLTGRGIIPTHDRNHWPAQDYLHEHRREWKP